MPEVRTPTTKEEAEELLAEEQVKRGLAWYLGQTGKTMVYDQPNLDGIPEPSAEVKEKISALSEFAQHHPHIAEQINREQPGIAGGNWAGHILGGVRSVTGGYVDVNSGVFDAVARAANHTREVVARHRAPPAHSQETTHAHQSGRHSRTAQKKFTPQLETIDETPEIEAERDAATRIQAAVRGLQSRQGTNPEAKRAQQEDTHRQQAIEFLGRREALRSKSRKKMEQWEKEYKELQQEQVTSPKTVADEILPQRRKKTPQEIAERMARNFTDPRARNEGKQHDPQAGADPELRRILKQRYNAASPPATPPKAKPHGREGGRGR